MREIGVDNTVILSTHIVDDIKDLCQQVAILTKGKILLNTSPAKAMAEIKGKVWFKIIERNELESAETDYSLLSSKYNADNSITIRVFSETIPFNNFSPVEPILEDVYFTVINKNIK